MMDSNWMSGLRVRTIASLFTVALLFAFVPRAQADYVTQSVTLDKSNALKDGVAYGSVLIEAYNGTGAAGGGLQAGEVRLTFNANILLDYVPISPTFGIDRVAFNTDLALKAANISGPNGWKVNTDSTVSAFGKFTWEVQGNASGGTRPNPVSVLLTGLGDDATVNHFLIGSTGAGLNPPTEGSVFFATHVAGFDPTLNEGETGHFVGGSTLVSLPPPDGSGEEPQPTPEPATLAMLGLGFGLLGLVQAARKRRSRDESVNAD